jgi:hypothetical protein
MAGSPRMVPTFIADRSTGAAPSFSPAASPRVRRRPSPWPPRQPRNTDAGVAHPSGQACTAPRPTSARLEPMPRLRGFSHWFAFTTPSRLACRTQAVWQYRPVPSLSGLLPPAPCASRTRLPPASTTRCDRPPLDLSFHSVNRRLVAHYVLAAQSRQAAGAATETARARSSSSKTACPTTFSVKAPVPVDRPYGRARTATLNYAVSCPETEQPGAGAATASRAIAMREMEHSAMLRLDCGPRPGP